MRDGLVRPVEAGFISYRCFGDPKIPKPKPLAGLNPVAKFPSRDGFIYADGWCKAFKRNEGYVRFTGLREQFDRKMLARPFIPVVSEAAYGCLERLSESDPRLYRLNGTCEQSVAYRRVASDIVAWLAKAAKDEEAARTANLTANDDT